MRDLVLTGFMGTGKTTVGRLLADRYGLEFVDLDELIERRDGRTVRTIFAESGEATFRNLERDALLELAKGGGRVVATGGGALISESSRAALAPGQRVICLTCQDGELLRRLDGAGEERPLLAGVKVDEILALLRERRAAYGRFEQVDTSSRTPEEVAAEIDQRTGVSSHTLRFDDRRSTTILFGRNSLPHLGNRLKAEGLQYVNIVFDDHVYQQESIRRGVYGTVPGSRGVPLAYGTLRTPSGEPHKNLAWVEHIYRGCANTHADRTSTIVAVGGGVVCDLAGYAAATYMRGIRLVLVPTTLLAQVDAAIGGKTAVDFGGIKNLVGAFHPAELVIVDPEVLRSLPDRALSDGIAEIVKIGAVFSADLLERVERLTGPRDILENFVTIRRSAELKARIVQNDPFEHGERTLLNFGHTVGHGVEAASRYRLPHGSAVSVGLVAETWLAEQLGIAVAGYASRLRAILERFGLPVTAPTLRIEDVMSFIASDKKICDGRLRCAFAVEPGRGTVEVVPESDIRRAVTYAVGEVR